MADVKKILIAEDEKPMATALSLKLTKAGYETVVVNNGQQALQELDSSSFNLLVLDLVMPEMDGFQVLEELKARGSSLPVMVASNLGQKSDQQKAKDLGAKYFLIKSNTSLADIVKHCESILKDTSG